MRARAAWSGAGRVAAALAVVATAGAGMAPPGADAAPARRGRHEHGSPAAGPAAGSGGPAAGTIRQAAGSTSQAVRLTLEEALERARAVAPRLAELGAERRGAEAEAERARAERLPRVDLMAGYTRLSGVPELALERDGVRQVIFPNLPDNVSLEAELEVPLYTGGRIEAAEASARATARALGEDRRTAGDALELEVTSAYWELVLAREQESVLAAAVASFEAHLADATNRLEVGLASPDEPLAVEVERDRAELRRLRAGSAAAVAEARLAILLDLPPGTAIDTAEPLQAGGRPADAVEPLVQEAMGLRPERAALARRVEAAGAGVQMADAARKPTVAAHAGLQYANPNRRVLPPSQEFNDSWEVSVSLLYTLFDGGRSDAEVAAARTRVEALEHRLGQLDREIRLQVVSAWHDMLTAGAEVEVAERALASARESRRVTADRYLEGLVPSSARLDAETAELRAGLDVTESLVRVKLATARLERAVGR